MSIISEAILDELNKYNKINKYIVEQEVGEIPPPAEGDVPPPAEGETPPPPAEGGAPAPTTEPEVVDIENDPDVEKLDGSGE